VVAAKLAIGMPRDPAEQELSLNHVSVIRLLEKGLGQSPSPARDRRTDQAEQKFQHDLV
jgi:hypothetical protein